MPIISQRSSFPMYVISLRLLFGVAAFANMVCVMGGRETPYMRDHLWILFCLYMNSIHEYCPVFCFYHFWLLPQISVFLSESSMHWIVSTVFEIVDVFCFSLKTILTLLIFIIYIYIVWYWPWQISMNIYLISLENIVSSIEHRDLEPFHSTEQ